MADVRVTVLKNFPDSNIYFGLSKATGSVSTKQLAVFKNVAIIVVQTVRTTLDVFGMKKLPFARQHFTAHATGMHWWQKRSNQPA